MSTHLPIRRTWLCTSCGRPWPCLTARVALLDEYADAPVALSLYLAQSYVECTADLHRAPAGDLYLRFLGWLQLRRPATAPDRAL